MNIVCVFRNLYLTTMSNGTFAHFFHAAWSQQWREICHNGAQEGQKEQIIESYIYIFKLS